ncbi:hypothetical protein Sjap_018082 [Stephania japonica]|uniref:Uncharacterized protein n=1 Tax=Stephania japonica TaxID=461633 RepID=A0AAP0I7E2_9MAGN
MAENLKTVEEEDDGWSPHSPNSIDERKRGREIGKKKKKKKNTELAAVRLRLGKRMTLSRPVRPGSGST